VKARIPQCGHPGHPGDRGTNLARICQGDVPIWVAHRDGAHGLLSDAVGAMRGHSTVRGGDRGTGTPPAGPARVSAPRIAVLVHNRLEQDPRVSRQARTIVEMGYRAAVLCAAVPPGPGGYRWGAWVAGATVYES